MSVRPVAFVRAEGILFKHGTLSFSAFLAANAQGFKERALRLGGVAAALPVGLLLGRQDRSTVNRAAYLLTRNMTEDRLEVLCEEYGEQLSRRLLTRGVELAAEVREQGFDVVVVAEGLEPVLTRAFEGIDGIHDTLANRLEIRDGVSTGKLEEPVVGGYQIRRWLEAYADGRGVALTRCRAYGAFASDLSLLGAVGEPCAVNPDYVLRRAATDARWPVVYYGGAI